MGCRMPMARDRKRPGPTLRALVIGLLIAGGNHDHRNANAGNATKKLPE
jgi:hypothetical protein